MIFSGKRRPAMTKQQLEMENTILMQYLQQTALNPVWNMPKS